jgi:hypothetical protein
MRFSKESPIPNSPRIDAAMPDAALPGGEIEVRGTHLGALRSRLPVATGSWLPFCSAAPTG